MMQHNYSQVFTHIQGLVNNIITEDYINVHDEWRCAGGDWIKRVHL